MEQEVTVQQEVPYMIHPTQGYRSVEEEVEEDEEEGTKQFSSSTQTEDAVYTKLVRRGR